MSKISSNQYLSFDDVLLVPQQGVLNSRADAITSAKLFDDIHLDIPIISAPMSCVTEANMAIAIAQAGGYGILHRFYPTIQDQVNDFLRLYKLNLRVGCALGINENYERFNALYKAGCRHFCIDIAHAHCEALEKWFLGIALRTDIYVMVGNVATAEGAEFLAGLGVDAVKVGIGPGAACQTREVTGFGVPQLTAIIDVAEALKDTGITIIADGGIKNSGDAVKALAAGADTVMLGRLLAGADESPYPGLYFGMASKRMNGHNAPEGVEGVVPHTGPVIETLKSIVWGIKSGISYNGSSNLEELRDTAEFQVVSSLSMGESKVRI